MVEDKKYIYIATISTYLKKVVVLEYEIINEHE